MTSPAPRSCTVRNVTIARGHPLAVIAGPCMFESLELGLEVGRLFKDACDALGLAYIFKASFDKANRSSVASARGPGIERGLEWLAAARDELGVPVTTDIHEPAQAGPVARVVDMLQIPAFLCRQTCSPPRARPPRSTLGRSRSRKGSSSPPARWRARSASSPRWGARMSC